MKITQEDCYKPITIVLETKDEALDFIGMIDQLDRFAITKDQAKLAIDIRNYFTNHIKGL